MLDRSMKYEKDRQYGRGLLVGPAIYLNPIEASMAQASSGHSRPPPPATAR